MTDAMYFRSDPQEEWLHELLSTGFWDTRMMEKPSVFLPLHCISKVTLKLVSLKK